MAQNALDLGLAYAIDRSQFGKPIVAFPRIADKLALMAAEIMAARQLIYHAAREKDAGRRCDLEAGMAKLLAARIAWSAADNALQIHGGNGFALEFQISPRAVRCPHPQHFRRRRRDPGAGHCPPPAGRRQLSTRTILITGCSSGIGYACAQGLKERGWRVFATARKDADIARLEAEGFEVLHLDYADPDSIAACVGRSRRAHRRQALSRSSTTAPMASRARSKI